MTRPNQPSTAVLPGPSERPLLFGWLYLLHPSQFSFFDAQTPTLSLTRSAYETFVKIDASAGICGFMTLVRPGCAQTQVNQRDYAV